MLLVTNLHMLLFNILRVLYIKENQGIKRIIR